MLNLPDLPNELLHQIAEHLHPPDWHDLEGRNTMHGLQSFSLICRRSRDVGQAHVFRDIVFSFRCAIEDERWLAEDGTTLPEWDHRGENEPGSPYRTLAIFCTFMREYPSLGQAIRRLKLIAYPRGPLITNHDSGPRPSNLGDDSSTEALLLHQLIALTPLLEELELKDMLITSTTEYWETLSGPLPALRRLDIDYLKRTDSQGHVGDILGCFSTIGNVRVRNLPRLHEWPDDIAPPNMRIASFTCLDEGSEVEVLLDYVYDSPSVETLRELYTGFSPSAFPVYDELLSLVRPNLECIGITVSQPGVLRADYDPPPNLSPYTKLRRLLLKCMMYHDMAPINNAEWDRLITVLSSCQTCDHLASVDILVWCPRGNISWLQSLNTSARRRMEDVLLKLVEVTSLRATRFMLCCRQPLSASAEGLLRHALPRLAEKGILRVAYSARPDIPAEIT
ncbi:uncharacterized protein PHACADRAFT_262004 [Phanerochaete carnosa HHB-10118-sp]|uniref:F-box domain-containing protein n=1 Tax=Phanerochaete carnosa (strain HHB-10118-sp) TaxID=650164 RepID=K5VYL5_PHACS|nr:uncharacterized protein PHACADRAFT_262004 [Phanerochaete carnosa HHB-10118-sp]EKM51704.1 hypothetical protein PHACADRAFT_262004 [Phanerochaete carnosa HHB-10118-sp]